MSVIKVLSKDGVEQNEGMFITESGHVKLEWLIGL